MAFSQESLELFQSVLQGDSMNKTLCDAIAISPRCYSNACYSLANMAATEYEKQYSNGENVFSTRDVLECALQVNRWFIERAESIEKKMQIIGINA